MYLKSFVYGGIDGISQFTPDGSSTDLERIEALEIAIQSLIAELKNANRGSDTTPVDAG